jgi:Cu(I)/Ag(I) efflux system membrane fusion protein
MDLVPAKSSAAAITVKGIIAVAPEMIQTMGVRTAPAQMTALTPTLRAFGRVVPNERLESAVVSRAQGWIEELAVNAVGARVESGDLLYRVYSPDLIAAQNDLVAALSSGNGTRIKAGRQRLRSLGMQDQVIDQVASQRKVIERVPVYAEAAGYASALSVADGAYVKPGSPIMQLQSYDVVWVMAAIPETDLPLLEEGAAAQLRFPSAPQAPNSGTVETIYPSIDPETRTGQARIEVANDSGALRPGAYADVTFTLNGSTQLTVPSEAILRSGAGASVVVALSEGRFAARPVETGITADGRTAIGSGLVAGELVVTSGQFLLGSEVNLREGLPAMTSQSVGPNTPLAQLPVDADTLAQIDHFPDMALYFHEALMDGYAIDPLYLDPAITLGDSLRVRYGGTRLEPIIANAQAVLRGAKEARSGDALAGKLAALMTALEPWLLDGAPQHYRDAGLHLFEDPETNQLWLQESSQPKNPYGAATGLEKTWPSAPPSQRPQQAADPHAGHR